MTLKGVFAKKSGRLLIAFIAIQSSYQSLVELDVIKFSIFFKKSQDCFIR